MIDLKILDKRQRAAAVDTEGYAVVIAGAGSGKTRVLASRVACLLDRGVEPESILCVTFTNKAADEMRSRIENYSGRDISGMQISTYHSLCAGILRRYGDAAGIPPDFAIYETDETMAVLDKVVMEHRMREPSHRQLQREIDRFKASLQSVEEWRSCMECRHERWYVDQLQRGMEAYESAMREENALDFSDLTRHATRLVSTHPDILRETSYRYILVDEYQDSSPVEAELVRLLSMRHGNLCAVGDPRQSIYGWRGSDFRLILDFRKNYPGAAKHVLDVNYRSARKIVEASEIVARGCTGAEDHRCRAFRADEGRLFLMQCAHQYAEADAIAAAIARMTAGGEASYSDIAVLCRTHAQRRAVEWALCRVDVPFLFTEKSGPYDRPEVRLALDCLRAVAGTAGATPLLPQDVLQSLRSLYHHGASLTALFDAVSLHTMRTLRPRPTPAKLAGLYLNSLRASTIDYTGPALQTLPAFLQSCQEPPDAEDAVPVMTVHAAKGLEWPVVFVSGLSESISHHPPEEERRLMYVAVTRACSTLCIGARP